jgi:hypothetical protein
MSFYIAFLNVFFMRKNLVILCFMVVWSFLTAVALLWGLRYDWPDFVHVDYGLPLTWATNTLSTIAGAANLWEVNVSNLTVDLTLWLAIVVAGAALMLYRLKE